MSRLLLAPALVIAFLAGTRVPQQAPADRPAGRNVTMKSAKPANPAAQRVFELRTYHTLPGRLNALNARFRDHTMAIFRRHGMTSVGYWIPVDSAASGNTLIYIISHASRVQADSNWAAFNRDPEWQRVAAASERDGKIIDHIERVYMSATDYSPIK